MRGVRLDSLSTISIGFLDCGRAQILQLGWTIFYEQWDKPFPNSMEDLVDGDTPIACSVWGVNLSTSVRCQ